MTLVWSSLYCKAEKEGLTNFFFLFAEFMCCESQNLGKSKLVLKIFKKSVHFDYLLVVLTVCCLLEEI